MIGYKIAFSCEICNRGFTITGNLPEFKHFEGRNIIFDLISIASLYYCNHPKIIENFEFVRKNNLSGGI